jgi:hypothetical protein
MPWIGRCGCASGIPSRDGLRRTWVNRLRAFKRLNVRREYRAGIHEALLMLACRLICWRRLERSW